MFYEKEIISVSYNGNGFDGLFALTACDFNKKAEAQTFVSMDINPSVEFTLDKNNKVLSVHGANEDGQVLLYGEEGIVGADIEVATAKVLELAKNSVTSTRTTLWFKLRYLPIETVKTKRCMTK